jgi:hypothetical protein
MCRSELFGIEKKFLDNAVFFDREREPGGDRCSLPLKLLKLVTA